MLRRLSPATVVRPFSRYAQAVAVPAAFRWLYISGQIGVAPDGALLDGFEAQARQAWAGVVALLEAGDMSIDDLVKVTIYLTNAGDLAASRAARDTALGDAEPASTLVIVAGLARPNLLIEIEAVAAHPA
jgi:2-iminobutanoate/2-iminopropanoate deaminase